MSSQQENEEMAGASDNPGHRRTGLMSRLRAYFLAGVLVTAPIAITLAMASWLINFVDSRIVPLIPARYNPDTYLREYFGTDIGLPGLGLVILIVAITLVGWITAGYLGRLVVRIGEAIVERMPIIRNIYGAVKQVVETVFRNQSQAFRQAVLVEYPRRGIWTIGFITGTTRGEVQTLTEAEVVNVFVPTTPNPTSGFLLFVPKADLVLLSMTIEDAIKMVMSGGIVVPLTPEEKAEKVKNDKNGIGRWRQPAPVAEASKPSEAPGERPAKVG